MNGREKDFALLIRTSSVYDKNQMGASTNISSEDRRAATNITTSRSGHRFEIQLGHLCNNRCVFCSSGQLTALKIARPVPIGPILEALDEARAAGATHLTFLGGEPTIHKRFLDILKHAVGLGFEHIVIFTNGVMFPHPGFIASVTALGRFEWRISIQGATEEAHVATTGREQSFERILHGLGELQRQGQLVTANMCVNERSFRSLPAYPDLITRYGIRQLHVDIVRPESTGERDEAYLREIMPRYTEMAPFYEQMLQGFEQRNPDFDINVGNLPYCILPGWGSHIHHGGQETVTKSSDGEGLEDEMNKYEWQASLRTHLPGCADCVFRTRCTGIFRVYLDLHGDSEFKPIHAKELALLDPEHRNIVLRLDSTLSSLRAGLNAGEAPGGWRLIQEVSEHRRRAIEMTLNRPNADGVTLRFVAPSSSPSAVLRTAEFDLEMDAPLACPPDALLGLVQWLSELLAISPAQERDATELTNHAYRRAALARGRQRVMGLAIKLRSAFPGDRWQIGPVQWASPAQAVVRLLGSNGVSTELRFSISNTGPRPKVGVEFVAGQETDTAELRLVIERASAAMRQVRGDAPRGEETSPPSH